MEEYEAKNAAVDDARDGPGFDESGLRAAFRIGNNAGQSAGYSEGFDEGLKAGLEAVHRK